MRKAAILVVGLLASVVPAAQATLPHPSSARIDVVREQSVVVRGERFKSDERVTVILVAAGRWSRSATAGEDGSFGVRFTVSMRCTPYSLHAFGSKGSRARTLREPRIGCSNPTQK